MLTLELGLTRLILSLQDMNMGSDDAERAYGKYSSLQRNDSGAATGGRSSLDWHSFDADSQRFEVDPNVPLEEMTVIGAGTPPSGSESSDGQQQPKAVIIGDELLHADANMLDEMQRKKEKIMMQSLRRKQQQEERRLQREEENRRRESEEREREEEKTRRREEERARRDAILEQHRLKKEMEKMEEERVRMMSCLRLMFKCLCVSFFPQGRMPEPVSARPVPKLRSAGSVGRSTRPRPKTIHVDQDQDLANSNLMASSRGGRGSSSNISGDYEELLCSFGLHALLRVVLFACYVSNRFQHEP